MRNIARASNLSSLPLAFLLVMGMLLPFGCSTRGATTLAPTLASPTTTPSLPPVSPSPTPTLTPSQTPSPSPTPEPPWYQPLDESYTVLRYGYALVVDPNAPLYPTLDDAVRRSFNRGYLPYTPAYVAFYHTETREGKVFYALASGNWMEGKDVQEISPSRFAGILLTRPVTFRFGWVLADISSTNGNGETVRVYHRYQIVHEFPDVPSRPGYIAIGGDEWLPDEAVALVSPQAPFPSSGSCRYIYVSLAEQTLRVYDHCQLIFATLVSTGKEKRWTPPGEFAILYKSNDKYITLSQPSAALSEYYLQAVPYFMSYYGNLAFHGAYWHDDFGYAVSHGCINLSPADARWLYEWARVGDQVIISDDP